MTPNVFARARIIGLIVVLCAFGLGAAAGYVVALRRPGGMTMIVTTTDEIPREIEALRLTAEQRAAVRAALRDGRPRVAGVMRELEPRMRAALRITEDEIEKVLTSVQVEQWREHRRANPPKTEERFIRK